MLVGFSILVLAVACIIGFYRHQKLLQERAHLLREAVRNRDFALRLPVRGLFFRRTCLTTDAQRSEWRHQSVDGSKRGGVLATADPCADP